MSLVDLFRHLPGLGDDPVHSFQECGSLRLSSRVSWNPTSHKALGIARLPNELHELYHAIHEAVLFEDVDFGQWGLRIYGSSRSDEATKESLKKRPGQFLQSDRVIGEFLGDSDLLVCDLSDPLHARYLVSLPIDPRPDWWILGSSLEAFLTDYVAHHGDKFWERQL